MKYFTTNGDTIRCEATDTKGALNEAHLEILHLYCSTGDAYRYTIQPMFHGLRSDVQCHVRRRQLNVLYELFFFIQLPPSKTSAATSGVASGIGQLPSSMTQTSPSPEPLFQTPKVYRTVRTDVGERSYRTRGKYTADYLTVEHDTGLDIDDELIIRRHDAQSTTSGGVRTNGGSGRGVSYTVRPSVNGADQSESAETGNNGDSARSRPPVHEISRNIYVVSTQFEKPFDYSTTTW